MNPRSTKLPLTSINHLRHTLFTRLFRLGLAGCKLILDGNERRESFYERSWPREAWEMDCAHGNVLTARRCKLLLTYWNGLEILYFFYLLFCLSSSSHGFGERDSLFRKLVILSSNFLYSLFMFILEDVAYCGHTSELTTASVTFLAESSQLKLW